ncbi:FecCD family ABC transporter permease [Promicromonospora sp. Populi]|uniref:FecCD family ABC transporter permease n=1 Tax=Promicromonospora sp. Populi TaxID=3239420 RepID=UPI0034E2AC36
MSAAPRALETGPGALRALSLGRWSVLLDPRSVLVCLLLATALAIAIVAAVLAGEHPMPIAALARVLSGTATPAEDLIIGQLRAPRVLTGAVVGLALGLAGALFQSVTRNPLGSPDVIGFDTGAATGALVAMLFTGGGVRTTALGAVAGGAGTAVAVLLLASGRGQAARHGPDALRLVLVGLGIGLGLAALNSLLVVGSNIYDAQSAAVWLIGNLAGRDWSRLALLAPVVAVGLVLALLLSRRLSVAELGDDGAAALGLQPGPLRLAAVAVGVLLASSAVATAGPIGFVALTAPQVARRLTRADGPGLPAAGLTGALVLVLADLAAREAFVPREVAVGVLTGGVGGLYLIWLLGREWRKGHA